MTWEVHSLARKGRRSRPSRGKDTWLLTLKEYVTSCRKRFRWIHRIWGKLGVTARRPRPPKGTDTVSVSRVTAVPLPPEQAAPQEAVPATATKPPHRTPTASSGAPSAEPGRRQRSAARPGLSLPSRGQPHPWALLMVGTGAGHAHLGQPQDLAVLHAVPQPGDHIRRQRPAGSGNAGHSGDPGTCGVRGQWRGVGEGLRHTLTSYTAHSCTCCHLGTGQPVSISRAGNKKKRV